VSGTVRGFGKSGGGAGGSKLCKGVISWEYMLILTGERKRKIHAGIFAGGYKQLQGEGTGHNLHALGGWRKAERIVAQHVD